MITFKDEKEKELYLKILKLYCMCPNNWAEKNPSVWADIMLQQIRLRDNKEPAATFKEYST